MTHEFQGSVYRTASAMHAAIASAWMSVDGANSDATIAEALAANTDAELVAEAMEGWNLPGVDLSDLVSAFADYRAWFAAGGDHDTLPTEDGEYNSNLPHAVRRRILEIWAEDDVDDEDSAKWLRDYPAAIWFGIDDGNIQCAFTDRPSAEAWIAEMRNANT